MFCLWIDYVDQLAPNFVKHFTYLSSKPSKKFVCSVNLHISTGFRGYLVWPTFLYKMHCMYIVFLNLIVKVITILKQMVTCGSSLSSFYGTLC
jgi:hypothetical protein